MAQRYMLESPTIARIPDDGSQGTILIPKDAIVEVDSDVGERWGLVPATFKGRAVQMFAEDIRQRGTLLAKKESKRA